MRASALSADAQPRPVARGSEIESSYHPTLDGLSGLLGPGLRRGTSYLVEGSTSLCLAMLAGASRAGSWCAAVGTPGIGLQTATGLGVQLERFALVPDPGEQWLEVTATLADAVDVILLRPPSRARPSDIRRLAARLRRSGSTLVLQSAPSWAGLEARLTVTDSVWLGAADDGRGYLSARHASVTVSGKGSPLTERLWLPAPDGGVRPYEQAVAAPVLRAVR